MLKPEERNLYSRTCGPEFRVVGQAINKLSFVSTGKVGKCGKMPFEEKINQIEGMQSVDPSRIARLELLFKYMHILPKFYRSLDLSSMHDKTYFAKSESKMASSMTYGMLTAKRALH